MASKSSILPSARNAFISGLLLITPISVTVFLIHFLINLVGEPALPIFRIFLPDEFLDKFWITTLLYVLATLFVFLFITLLGFFSKLLIGRFFVNTFERILTNVPVVRQVYLTVKQIIDTFSQQQKAVFQKAVLIEYPRRGMFAVGFMTSDARGEIQERTRKSLVSIFVPTTPNPTSGYLLLVAEDEVTDLDMSITDAMKLIISGGAVVPKWTPDLKKTLSTAETH